MTTVGHERPATAADPADPPPQAAPGAVWARDNQRHLVLHAEAVAARLDGRPADAERPERAAALLAAEVAADTGTPVALHRIARLFGLTRFEQDVLLAATAPELGLPCATGPATFSRALATLPDPHWSALLPDAPLRHWRLADLPPEPAPGRYGGLAQLPLAVDERVLHALVGADTLDERLRGRARAAEDLCRLAPGQLAAVGRLAALVAPGPVGRSGPATLPRPVSLVGEDRLTRRQAAVQAARALGLSTLVTEAGDVPPDAPTAELYGRLLAREAALGGRLLLIEAPDRPIGPGHGPDGDPAAFAGPAPTVLRLAADTGSYGVPVVLSLAEPPAGATAQPVLRLPVAGPGERRELFAAALADSGRSAGPAELAELAQCTPLTPAAIALGVERGVRLAAPGSGAVPVPDLVAACRAADEQPLHGLARLCRPGRGLDSLVLAEPAERALRAMLAQVRQRGRVHDEWGHPGPGERGLAVTALFSGPSGTGKTTAAEAVAAELGRDLVCADLGQLVSKYIGETEKNLSRLFAAAEAGAVLLFDEGESLFGRRTAVHDSRDRYANLEVSFLLQRLETFGGICIVTTNTREAMDSAFLRRMRFVVTFPFPDAEQRARLWERAFPPGVPVDGLDPARLAQVAVAGGTIAQLALHAAFLAADADEPVRMAHVREAVRIECEKLERPLSPHELRGWE
ncbi:ATP-binding protein [Streptomyces sp. 1331.2]|uniref:ATP-binding protein n=1 Tax=Streptomyces sp. 1331.2 TaxID=1938835 RepID=UPI000BC38930|nr:ATP-binding protein [Streptomyces sp. 1331.2]SOB86212.1 ATPase family associated with various cellular activities (AAA) [Streptomyces sp. 1331.2]